MNYKILSLFCFLSIGFLFNSCDDDFVDPLAGASGLYPPNISAVEGVSPCFDANDLTLESGFSIDIDESETAEVTGVDVYVTYYSTDADGNVVQSGPDLVESLTSFPAEYKTTPLALAGPLGIAESDIKLGDRFVFSYGVKNANKAVLTTNTQTIAVSLPATIGGTYIVTTNGQSTDGCCPDPTSYEGEVTITDNGDNTYVISDVTGGMWVTWYSIYGITGGVEGNFSESCNQINLFGITEPFGSNISGGGTVNPLSGVINIDWLADSWGDVGSMVLTPVE